MIEHGSNPEGQHIARVGRLILIVEQTPVYNFGIGDKIGWGEDREHWLGTIVISERDTISMDGDLSWHLAWVKDGDPATKYHWRGRTTVRDTRWFPDDVYEIEEVP